MKERRSRQGKSVSGGFPVKEPHLLGGGALSIIYGRERFFVKAKGEEVDRKAEAVDEGKEDSLCPYEK